MALELKAPEIQGERAAGECWIRFFHFILFYMGAELIYNAVLVSGVQQSDSTIPVHMSILFQILFPYRLLQNTE